MIHSCITKADLGRDFEGERKRMSKGRSEFSRESKRGEQVGSKRGVEHGVNMG